MFLSDICSNCVCSGSMFVSTCKYQMLVSSVQPIVICSAVFCIVCSYCNSCCVCSTQSKRRLRVLIQFRWFMCSKCVCCKWVQDRGWDSIVWDVCACHVLLIRRLNLMYSVGSGVKSVQVLSELSMGLFYLVQVWMLCRYSCMCTFTVCMLLCVSVISSAQVRNRLCFGVVGMSDVYMLKSVDGRMSPALNWRYVDVVFLNVLLFVTLFAMILVMVCCRSQLGMLVCMSLLMSYVYSQCHMPCLFQVLQ